MPSVLSLKLLKLPRQVLRLNEGYHWGAGTLEMLTIMPLLRSHIHGMIDFTGTIWCKKIGFYLVSDFCQTWGKSSSAPSNEYLASFGNTSLFFFFLQDLLSEPELASICTSATCIFNGSNNGSRTVTVANGSDDLMASSACFESKLEAQAGWSNLGEFRTNNALAVHWFCFCC